MTQTEAEHVAVFLRRMADSWPVTGGPDYKRLYAIADALERITPEGIEVLEMAVGNLPHGFSADDAAANATLAALRLSLLPPA